MLPALVAQENAREFLREVRTNQVQQFIQSQSTVLLRPTDILKPLPPSSFDIGKILQILFAPRRKLRPERTERAPVTIVPQQKCELLIQINRGFNIPNRKVTQGAFAKPTLTSSDIADVSLISFSFVYFRSHSNYFVLFSFFSCFVCLFF